MIVEMSEGETRFPDLTPSQPYVVLGIEADDLRILNDQGKPYLYPQEIFKVVDSREPSDWVSELGEDNERYAYPPSFNGTGFFEDYFEGLPDVVATFWRAMNRRLSAAA
ncbi:MAG TPA: hypothetical protein VGS22_30385 [Thermoanaerobaculia bacterium]|jgi:hypothetical protein|nr:hypothetical protein [Thermoanaerobaculia bacterium]